MTASLLIPQIAPAVLPIIAALLLWSRKDQDSPDLSSPDPEDWPYRVIDSREKGQGAFARRPLSRGDVIQSEQPLVVWPTDLGAKEANALADEMTPEARAQLTSLVNSQPSTSKLDPILGIRGSNGFNVQLPRLPADVCSTRLAREWADGKEPHAVTMIFPRISRINHSCLPNADHALDWASLTMTVYATTDIPEGDEISIEYTAGLIQKPKSERDRILSEQFGFACRCKLCDSDVPNLSASDARRTRLDELVRHVERVGLAGQRAEVVKGLQEIQSLLKAEGYVAMPEFSSASVSNAYALFASVQSA